MPAGATRLYLGVADALEFGHPTSFPGFYNDNVGELSATVTQIPAPGAAGLLALSGLLVARRRR